MSDEADIVKELREKEKQGLLKNKFQKTHNDSETSNILLQRSAEDNGFLRTDLFNSLLINIPDSIYFKDKEGRFIEASKSKIEHLDVDKESIIGKTDFDFYLEEEAQKMRKDEIYIMENEEVLETEEKVTRPNGETSWVSVVKSPRYDEGGNVVGIIGISRDITKQKSAERDLHESETKYRTIFENSAVAIMMTNEKEQVTQWNRYTEQLLDMQKEELMNKPVNELYPKEEWEKIREENIREKGMQHHLETKMLRKNGETIDVDISLSVLKNKNDEITGSIGVIRNITERKKMEGELKDAHQMSLSVNKQLERKVNERTAEIEKLLKQKDEFIGQLGHDLKTPLTPLNSLLPLVRKKETNEQSIKYLDLSIHNVRYMKNLIEKTLKLALFNSTSFNLDVEDINVYDIFDRVIQNMSNSLKENKIKVENLVNKDVVIKADKLRFEELLDNIISNAIKYSPEGGKVTINAKRENNEIEFSIKDTGKGMTKEQSERIFDEFYKADESRHDFNSTGLGLSICKRLVKKHGGKIWVESPGLNKGSTFYFTFEISENVEKK